MKIIVAGVNYASSAYASRFADAWTRCEGVQHVLVVDNFSTEAERQEIARIAAESGAEAIFRKNDGYGAALNDVLRKILAAHQEEALVLFGNVDVLPVSVGAFELGPRELPELRVLQGRRNRNPFLTVVQSKLVPASAIALRMRSATMLKVQVAASKLIGAIPARTWAVHGSLFGATTGALRELVPIFDPGSFLYCEELFFARRAAALGYRFRQVPITVDHVGSVSTASAVKSSASAWFETWAASMRRYLDT